MFATTQWPALKKKATFSILKVLSVLIYSPVNLDKLECYQAICKDNHQGKDLHYQIQGHSTGLLTLPNRKTEIGYGTITMFIALLMRLFQFILDKF